jgi:hypothetical protein
MSMILNGDTRKHVYARCSTQNIRAALRINSLASASSSKHTRASISEEDWIAIRQLPVRPKSQKTIDQSSEPHFIAQKHRDPIQSLESVRAVIEKSLGLYRAGL